MIWNESRECLEHDEMIKLQENNLINNVKSMYQKADYYRKKMQKSGLEPKDICKIDDLYKLPFTTWEDIMKIYPCGMYVVSQSEIARYHTAEDEDGNEIIVGHTLNDIGIWNECMARAIYMAGLNEKDVIQIAYPYGMFMGGLGAQGGVEKIGATVVPYSIRDTYTLIEMMKELKVTGIVCTPTYLLRISSIIEKNENISDFKLKSAICGMEPLEEKVRLKIEKVLGIKVYDTYNMNIFSEFILSGECECHFGSHIQEDYFLTEVIDTDTLEQVKDGEIGELVVTTLNKQGVPLMRYRTGHRVSMTHSKCNCGRTTARIFSAT